jgi:hypothetical protein
VTTCFEPHTEVIVSSLLELKRQVLMFYLLFLPLLEFNGLLATNSSNHETQSPSPSPQKCDYSCLPDDELSVMRKFLGAFKGEPGPHGKRGAPGFPGLPGPRGPVRISVYMYVCIYVL